MISAMPRIAVAVHDFESALSSFRNDMGMPVTDMSERTLPSLGARVAMCQPDGGSNIELMSPADLDRPLSQALQKFLDRRGEGVYAMMLEAADPNTEAELLIERGITVLPLMPGAGGRDIHPRSTHGVLIRIYPDDSVRQPDNRLGDAPHFTGIQKVVVATWDVDLTAQVYREGFGLPVTPPTVDATRGLLCSTVSPPKGGVIELVSPLNCTRGDAVEIEAFLKSRGQGVCALVLGAIEQAPEQDFCLYGTRFLIDPGSALVDDA